MHFTLNITYQFIPVTFQKLNSHMWGVATTSDQADIENLNNINKKLIKVN